MKKILAILISIMFCGGAYADVQQAEITHCQYRPHWSMVAPTKWSDVAYKEPIKRGKWVKPVAWVGYVGTLFIEKYYFCPIMWPLFLCPRSVRFIHVHLFWAFYSVPLIYFFIHSLVLH